MSYVSHLSCSVCRAEYPADRVMNLCEHDHRPVQIVLDLERLKRESGQSGWWNPARRDLWRFGGLLPLDINNAVDRPHVVSLDEGCTPCRPYDHPLALKLGCRLEMKDEGKHYPGFGRNPTLSFKDRGMTMTVAMARSLGISRLAVPTQGNAGDSLAEYAVAAGIEAVVVMAPETDMPVLGKVAAYARLHPENVKLEIVPGTIIDCGKRVREEYVPRGYFNVATFQEPGWRTEGKKTLGLEMAEPAGDGLAEGRWQVPDVIVYPTGGGTGVVGMAKAFDELETLGLIGAAAPDDLRSVHREHTDRPSISSRSGRHRAQTARAHDRNRPECGAKYWAYQRSSNHPRDRRLCRIGHGRCDSRHNSQRVARATNGMVTRGSGHPGGASRPGRSRHDQAG